MGRVHTLIPTRCRPPGVSRSEEPCKPVSRATLVYHELLVRTDDVGWIGLKSQPIIQHKQDPVSALFSEEHSRQHCTILYLGLGMLVRYKESASEILHQPTLANKLTKIDGPNTCPSREVDHSPRILDRSQVEFPVQQHEKQLMRHV